MLKTVLALGLVVVLTACGGGGTEFGPSVSEIKAQTLSYGKTASIYVAGRHLRNDMQVDSGSCTQPTFSASSTPDLAILNCTATASGALPITVKSATGEVLFRATLTVPKPQVTMITSKGVIVMELASDVVPATVNNFLSYVNSGYYRDTLFHRVIAGFVVQGGGYTSGLVKKNGQSAPIALETNKGLLNLRANVAMARTSEPNSATSEFFVNLVDNLFLDYQTAGVPGYAVFGTVTQGMDVVDAIAALPTGTVGGTADVPNTEVSITLAFQSK